MKLFLALLLVAVAPMGITVGNKDATQVVAAKTSSSKKELRLKYGSRAALVMDAKTGEILFEKDAGRRRSVASLTKLMTAIIYLETKPDLDRKVKVTREDKRYSGRTQLRTGERVRIKDLLYHSLMSSDNAATKTLVRVSGVASDEFLKRMNRKAAVLGLHQTQFVEFTGLKEGNVSSASDMAQLLRFALNYPLIAKITSEAEYSYRSNVRNHRLVNTNRLITYQKMDVKGGKTGYIRRAGYCLATWVHEGNSDLIAVILGAPSNPARFAEAKRLVGQLTPPQTSALPRPQITSSTGL